MEARNDITRKIPLFARRTVGEKINTSLDFLRQNWRTALKLSIYILLPLALLQSVGTFTLVKSIASDYQYSSTDSSFLLTLLLTIIGMCLSYTVILTLFQYYMGSDDGDLSMLTFSDTRGQLWRNFKKVFVSSLPIITLMAIISLVMFVLMFLPLVSILALLAYAVLCAILMMVPIYYVLEEIPLGDAFKRSYGHAKESWGRMLGLICALFFVISIIQSVTAVPVMVYAFLVENLVPSAETLLSIKLGLDVILYILLIVQSFFSYMTMVLVITCLVFHYGSNARENDDLAIAHDIDNFANL